MKYWWLPQDYGISTVNAMETAQPRTQPLIHHVFSTWLKPCKGHTHKKWALIFSEAWSHLVWLDQLFHSEHLAYLTKRNLHNRWRWTSWDQAKKYVSHLISKFTRGIFAEVTESSDQTEIPLNSSNVLLMLVSHWRRFPRRQLVR